MQQELGALRDGCEQAALLQGQHGQHRIPFIGLLAICVVSSTCALTTASRPLLLEHPGYHSLPQAWPEHCAMSMYQSHTSFTLLTRLLHFLLCLLRRPISPRSRQSSSKRFGVSHPHLRALKSL